MNTTPKDNIINGNKVNPSQCNINKLKFNKTQSLKIVMQTNIERE